MLKIRQTEQLKTDLGIIREIITNINKTSQLSNVMIDNLLIDNKISDLESTTRSLQVTSKIYTRVINLRDRFRLLRGDLNRYLIDVTKIIDELLSCFPEKERQEVTDDFVYLVVLLEVPISEINPKKQSNLKLRCKNINERSATLIRRLRIVENDALTLIVLLSKKIATNGRKVS